jgi:hypothetical protein
MTTLAAEDNWHGVTDLKERKRIQDKLAQRARRKVHLSIPLSECYCEKDWSSRGLFDQSQAHIGVN